MFARRRALIVLATVAVVASSILWAAPAYAACTSVPGSTPGTDVTVAGEDVRVPAISNIRLCSDSVSVPGARVATSGGNCDNTCLTLYVLGGEADGGGVTVSWSEDGSTRSQTVNPGGVGAGDEVCVLSVGVPDAPDPNCLVAIGPDDPSQLVDEIRDLVLGPVEPVCDAVPPQQDPWGGQTEFCDSPAQWVQLFCEQNPGVCGGDLDTYEEIAWRVVCVVVDPDVPECDQ